MIATFTCTGNEPVTGISAKFIVTNPNPTITATISNDGGYTEKVWTEYPDAKKEIYSGIQNSNYTLTQDDYTAVIPAGFAYGTSSNVGTISTGLVITDSVDNGYSTGNEFVWIPVNKTNLTVGKTNKKMAEISSGSDYKGVLYIYSTGNTLESSTLPPSSWGFHEPNVTSYDTGDYASQGITATVMQDRYNSMIASIKKYGGFYVARYEMGKNDFSKLGIEPTSAAENETKMWYGLYNKAKSYNKAGVTSQMIWGSQYDAILNFGLANPTDSSKVNAKNNGNQSTKKCLTGTYIGADCINNIFDLEGNMTEWTQQSSGAERVFRGGFYDPHFDEAYQGPWAPSDESSTTPNSTSEDYATRLSFYINE